jgi:hypothetical protein
VGCSLRGSTEPGQDSRWIISHSPHSIQKTLKTRLRKCQGSKKGGEEAEEVQGSYRADRCRAWTAGCNRGIRGMCAIAVQRTYMGCSLTWFNQAWARSSNCKPFAAQIRLGLYRTHLIVYRNLENVLTEVSGQQEGWGRGGGGPGVLQGR